MSIERQTTFHYSGGQVSGATDTITVHTPANDPDGDSLTYSWSVAPYHVCCPNPGTINGSGLTATWNRPAYGGKAAAGDAIVTASDGRGGTDTFTIRVGREP